MRRKWASLSTRGRLSLSAELLDLPRDMGEFVIVHELVHLLVPSHSKLFKSYLHAYFPDWETRQARLMKIEQAPRETRRRSKPVSAPSPIILVQHALLAPAVELPVDFCLHRPNSKRPSVTATTKRCCLALEMRTAVVPTRTP